MIDPSVITLAQTTFLKHISPAFVVASGYAFNLLYLFAAIELAILGLVWALQREIGIDRILLKIIKLGVIFFVIQNYQLLLSAVVNSFAKLAGVVIDYENVSSYVFNPAKIWEYGYDLGIGLLQSAATNDFMLFGVIQMVIAIGILLVFGFLGTQLVVSIVGFYLVSFGVLILLPVGAFTATRNFFDKGISSVLQAGLRLMTTIIIIGIAVVVWDSFELNTMLETEGYNLNQPLGLFFSSLLFLNLAMVVPKLVANSLGEIISGFLGENESSSRVIVVSESSGGVATTGSFNLSTVQAASTITTGSGLTGAVSNVSVSATLPVTTTSGNANFSSSMGILGGSSGDKILAQAGKISKSISEDTVKKIKESVIKAVKEKDS